MESKYFTPDKEEIHIGYECEYCNNYGFEAFNQGEEEWIPIKIKLQEEDGAYTSEIEDILIGMDDGYQPIRVAYLTKEQIEAEGWKESDTEGFFDKVDDPKDRWYINWYSSTHCLTIGDNENEVDYTGPCKDINTFRTICKLLKI
jgi:hypothetical protein